MRALRSRLGPFVGAVALATAVLLSVLGAPSVTAAQDATAQARQLYGEAQALFDAGQYPAAEARFRQAFEAVPNPVVLKAIAASQERQGNITGAVETLNRYLESNPSDRAEIESRIRELTSRPATMTFGSTPPGAAIHIDGTDTGQVTPATLQMAGGQHRVEFHLAGYTTHTQDFTAQPSQRARLDITLHQGSGEEVFGNGGDGNGASGSGGGGGGGSADPSVGVWVTAGIAALGLVSGTVFGFLALSEQSNFDAQPANDIADRGETFALVADISFGVAAAAAITAIVLYIVEASSGSGDSAELELEEPRLTAGGWADQNGGGVAAQLSF